MIIPPVIGPIVEVPERAATSLHFGQQEFRIHLRTRKSEKRKVEGHVRLHMTQESFMIIKCFRRMTLHLRGVNRADVSLPRNITPAQRRRPPESEPKMAATEDSAAAAATAAPDAAAPSRGGGRGSEE